MLSTKKIKRRFYHSSNRGTFLLLTSALLLSFSRQSLAQAEKREPTPAEMVKAEGPATDPGSMMPLLPVKEAPGPTTNDSTASGSPLDKPAVIEGGKPAATEEASGAQGGQKTQVKVQKTKKKKPLPQPPTGVPSLTTKDGKLSSGQEVEDNKNPDSKARPNIVVNIGKNPLKNTPVVKRYDDDEAQISATEPSGKGRFYKGGKVDSGTAHEESIRYVYISRGAWLIRTFQPYLDRLGLEVIKTDNSDLYAGYMESSRTFSYLCLLIASDDGSDKMLKAIGKAVALHREAVSNLRLQWSKKNEAVTGLFEEYIQSTFFKNLDEKTLKIPAGSLSNSQYKTLKETYPADEGDGESTPLQFFDRKDLKSKK